MDQTMRAKKSHSKTSEPGVQRANSDLEVEFDKMLQDLGKLADGLANPVAPGMEPTVSKSVTRQDVPSEDSLRVSVAERLLLKKGPLSKGTARTREPVWQIVSAPGGYRLSSGENVVHDYIGHITGSTGSAVEAEKMLELGAKRGWNPMACSGDQHFRSAVMETAFEKG